MTEPRQDEQDKEFGSAAAEDQDSVDRLSDEEVSEEEMPEEKGREPRAAGKARPGGE